MGAAVARQDGDHRRRRRRRLKAEVAVRIADGESLRAIGAEPGSPCAGTLRTWAATDAGFAAALAAARMEAGALLYPAVAAEFLARARAAPEKDTRSKDDPPGARCNCRGGRGQPPVCCKPGPEALG